MKSMLSIKANNTPIGDIDILLTNEATPEEHMATVKLVQEAIQQISEALTGVSTDGKVDAGGLNGILSKGSVHFGNFSIPEIDRALRETLTFHLKDNIQLKEKLSGTFWRTLQP